MPSRSSCGKRSGETPMASRLLRMIRRAAEGGPRTPIAVQDARTATGPARTIIQDRLMTVRTAVHGPDHGPGRTPAARIASRRSAG
jgi:hypothetical protein